MRCRRRSSTTGSSYVKAVNGYIREDMADNPDVKRGLYMLSIPSNFIFKIDLTEWGHVFKERNANGSANPEVKQCCESIADQIEQFHSSVQPRAVPQNSQLNAKAA